MFETLDTTSRRLRFPEDSEIIVTDTVGFIRDLPKELIGAFRTTLEELHEADLLLHVVDAGAADVDVQISAVVDVLRDLGLDSIPRMLVLNKCDCLPPDQVGMLARRYHALGISAIRPETLRPLLAELSAHVSRLMVDRTPSLPGWPQNGEPALASRP
jgi:GTP-binding protein HflX